VCERERERASERAREREREIENAREGDRQTERESTSGGESERVGGRGRGGVVTVSTSKHGVESK
jgi:hypothetical protein